MSGLDPTVWAGLIVGLVGAWRVWRLVRPEAESTNIQASRENVTMSLDIAERLTLEIEGLRTQLEQVKTEHERQMQEIRVELVVVRRERDELRRENVTLRERVAHLELQVSGG